MWYFSKQIFSSADLFVQLFALHAEASRFRAIRLPAHSDSIQDGEAPPW